MATSLGMKFGPVLTALTPDQEDVALTPATTGEGLRAAAEESFQGSLGPLLYRSIQRWTTDSPMLTADEANQKYAIGDLKFNNPISDTSAQQMYQTKQASMQRQDVVRRSDLGLVGRLGAGLVGAALDPTNLAAAVFPEAILSRVARIGEDVTGTLGALGAGARSLQAGREGGIAGRAAYGAFEGAVGTAAVTPGTYALSRSEGADYSLSDAFLDTVFGTALGAGLHATLGAFHKSVSEGTPMPAMEQAMQDAGPQVRQDTLRSAVSDVMSGRPVDVGDIVTSAINKYSDNEFDRLLSKNGELTAEERSSAAKLDKAKEAAGADSLSARIDEIQQDLDATRADRDAATSHADEMSARSASLIDGGTDEATAQRLSQVEYELNWPQGIPAKRRAELEAERSLLTEGAGPSAEESALEALRSQAEAKGLGAAVQRGERDLTTAQAKQSRAASAVDKAQQIHEETTGNVASRRATIQALTERTLRRFAGGLGIGVNPDDITAAARRIVSTPPEMANERVRFEMQRIGNLTRGAANDDMQDAFSATTLRKAQEFYDPSDLAMSQSVDTAAAATPARKARTPDQGIGAVSRDTQELDALDAAVSEELAAAKAAGRITEADEAHIVEAEAATDQSQALGKARDLAAFCLGSKA